MIESSDTAAFLWSSPDHDEHAKKEVALRELCRTWPDQSKRTVDDETDWIDRLSSYLDELVRVRLEHVHSWISSNTSRFVGTHANAAVDDLRREFESAGVELKRNVQLCKTKCASCHLLCLRGRSHGGGHDCTTDHVCVHQCSFVDEHPEILETCGLP